jgi:hypothetical protein
MSRVGCQYTQKAFAAIHFGNECESHPRKAHHESAMGPCPECGADRLVPLTFQAARTNAGDLERPEVVSMRPIAKCGGCGARIYADKVTHRDDPSETAQSDPHTIEPTGN